MSLEGLNALIQLESTRLEGAKQSNQNSSQVNSAVQQIGLQTASSKQSMTIQKINAEYEKDCAGATVRRLEQKLARERQAENLAGTIAALVTIGSGLSNLFNAGNDLFNGGQKLGDIPESLQVKAPSPGADTTKVNVVQSPGTTGQAMYLSGVSDGRQVAMMAVKNPDGTYGGFRSASFNDDQIKQIVGDEKFKELHDKCGSNISFDKLMEVDPKTAMLLMQPDVGPSHPMTREEAKGFMDGVNGDNIKGKKVTSTSVDKDSKITRVPEGVVAIDGDKDIPALQNGLIDSGKATEHDFKGGLGKLWDNTKDTGKALFSAVLQTAQDAVPYFQAYLKAKERADNTLLELQEAVAKLNAASKKLKNIEQSIDAFSGKGT
jgi:hypothetical protein